MAKFLRARDQIADNFENNSLVWGIFSLLISYFLVFHSRLSDPDSLASRTAGRLIRPPTSVLALLCPTDRPSVHVDQRAAYWTDFHEILCW
jgi:hypothetical protein